MLLTQDTGHVSLGRMSRWSRQPTELGEMRLSPLGLCGRLTCRLCAHWDARVQSSRGLAGEGSQRPWTLQGREETARARAAGGLPASELCGRHKQESDLMPRSQAQSPMPGVYPPGAERRSSVTNNHDAEMHPLHRAKLGLSPTAALMLHTHVHAYTCALHTCIHVHTRIRTHA